MQHFICKKHYDNNTTLLFSYFGYLSKFDEGSSGKKDRTWEKKKAGRMFCCSIACSVFMFVCIYVCHKGYGHILGTSYNSRVSFLETLIFL